MTISWIVSGGAGRWLLQIAGMILLCACTVCAQGNSSRADGSLKLLQDRHDQLHAQFAREMNRVADMAAAQSFLSDAERIRQRAERVDSGAFDLDDLPDELLPSIPLTLPPEEQTWRMQLRKLEKDYAVQLYGLARDAISKRHSSLAMELIREVAFRDPDNAKAREMLGFVRDGAVWTTPFAASMKRQGYVDHPRFGWIPKAHQSRYEAGDRFFDGRWMSAEKEALQRADFRNGWEVPSEHFLVRTNHSLERGVLISRALEDFHDFFLREYAAFFRTPQQIQRLFDAGTTRSGKSSQRYMVYYFRNKDEYVAALEERQPGVAASTGLYLPSDRIAYFYFDPKAGDAALETMFHEATHQLLGESTPRSFEVGSQADFWIIEGFACYIESFQPMSATQRIGHPRHLRIYWARRKAIDEEFFVPLRKLTALGKLQFQNADDAETLRNYYNQSAGVVHFFLHYQNGIYRDALIDYLSQVYSPAARQRGRGVSLEQLTGVPFEVLDQQYLEHLRSLPQGPPLGAPAVPVASGESR